MSSRGASARPRGVAAVAAAVVIACASSVASASVRRSGDWPAGNAELVTFSAKDLSRAEAIRQLADKVGWSVVVQGVDDGADSVDIHVAKQPATKVLDLILRDGNYVAQRDGQLISIAPTPAAPVAGDDTGGAGSLAPPQSAVVDRGRARRHGKDRVVTGSSIIVGKDEVVGDLVVFGGSADVLGQVSGDVSVFAGSVHVREGGRVLGDVATFGGSVALDRGARVDGDLSVVGGSVKRDEGAIVGGQSVESGAGEDDDADESRAEPPKGFSLRAAATAVGSALTRTALLFAFGAVLWALAGRRVERLQSEATERPMRSFAIGVVGLIAAAVAAVVLCVTVVGIPVAVVGVLAGVVGAYAGVCALLTTAGAALMGRRTSSPYVHLAIGCAAYLVLSSIPFVGQFVTAAVILMGFGALVATRGAGLIPRRRASVGGPANAGA
jgi:cytoskeletal protein CcmA (bactofilin family)